MDLWFFPTESEGWILRCAAAFRCTPLPTCLCSKGWGGGGKPQHVQPITSRIWKSESELKEVRVWLPAWQGKGNRRALEILSPVRPRERERKEAGSQGSTLPSAEQLRVGSVQQNYCQPRGNRFTLGHITGSTELELSCRALGKEAGGGQRGEVGMCRNFDRDTACQAICHIWAV